MWVINDESLTELKGSLGEHFKISGTPTVTALVVARGSVVSVVRGAGADVM